jgi:hypothetical protein
MNRISDMLAELATCLCAQIVEDGSPETCFCGVLAGETVIADYTGECADGGPCGQAWVRLITAYPASGVGLLDETPGNCGSELGIDIEVGILRCFPSPDEDGSAPTADEMLAAAFQQHQDILTLHRAIYCCNAISSKDAVVSSYTPMGPLGGLYGGRLTVMVTV